MQQKSSGNLEAAIDQALHGSTPTSQSSELDPFVIAQNVQKHLLAKGITLPQTAAQIQQSQQNIGAAMPYTQQHSEQQHVQQPQHSQREQHHTQQQRTKGHSQGHSEPSSVQPAKKKKGSSPSDASSLLTPELTGLLKEYVEKLEITAKAEQKQSKKKGLFFTTKK